ncbi:restriction endonuclease [uncultured Nostoc sp.]|uniref:restriction endonuclease n=1 Tax=uncultured Nostoc sp. TaxID=340711 RepID=UPI0026027923|nr:restriction endonuclease [uncultured Nostoc sp.]
MINYKDSFTRMQQYFDLKVEEDNKKRQSQEQARVDDLKHKRQKRQELRSELIALYQETDPYKRGKKLEPILNSFFKSENVLLRESFTITGENSEGIIQQIDGAIEVNNHLYLVEMKWWKEALSPKDVAQHMMRIFLRSDARGIFISESGYTEAAIIDIKKALSQKLIILFTLKELVLLLEGDDSFESLLRSKVEAVQLDGRLLYVL